MQTASSYKSSSAVRYPLSSDLPCGRSLDSKYTEALKNSWESITWGGKLLGYSKEFSKWYLYSREVPLLILSFEWSVKDETFPKGLFVTASHHPPKLAVLSVSGKDQSSVHGHCNPIHSFKLLLPSNNSAACICINPMTVLHKYTVSIPFKYQQFCFHVWGVYMHD